ncbi:MAG: GNAT family N-acetyltransferase [Candidatus Gracilibacteria bacterium]|nr:GNAT family N-acetyltransferase [Candidatus Gracilibacteria bacterium]
MKIIQAKNLSDFLKINDFFGKIWKEEFNIDIFDKIDEYKKQIIYFIEKDGIIISAITCKLIDTDSYIRRFATNKNNRGIGIGTILLNELIENLKGKGIKKIFVTSEIKRISFYEKFSFIKFGIIKNVGNTQVVEMKKDLI